MTAVSSTLRAELNGAEKGGPEHDAEIFGQVTDLVQGGEVDRRVDEVDHVVQAPGEPVDVLPVERGDERAVELLEDGVGDVVGGVLDLVHPLRQLVVPLGPRADELA